MRNLWRIHLALALLLVAVVSARADSARNPSRVESMPAPGELEGGFQAWSRIYAVLSHSRCANCHTNADNIPMWTDPAFGGTRVHGMNIHAGESRTGAESLRCTTCHVTSERPNTVPHAPPHTNVAWRLAPAEFAWFGKDSRSACGQLRDPQRNGGRDGAGLVDHIASALSDGGFIAWAFDPGAGREPAPGTLRSHLEDMEAWVGAGMPCPE